MSWSAPRAARWWSRSRRHAQTGRTSNASSPAPVPGRDDAVPRLTRLAARFTMASDRWVAGTTPPAGRPPASPAVLVTGASTGVGRACALHLDSREFRVFAAVRRDEDADALRGAASSRLTPLLMDVTDAEAISSAAATVGAAAGDAGLQGLVNNAGIALGDPLEFVRLDDVRRVLEVNLVGSIAVT